MTDPGDLQTKIEMTLSPEPGSDDNQVSFNRTGQQDKNHSKINVCGLRFSSEMGKSPGNREAVAESLDMPLNCCQSMCPEMISYSGRIAQLVRAQL